MYAKIHSDIAIPCPLRSSNNCKINSRQLVQILINCKFCKIRFYPNVKLNRDRKQNNFAKSIIKSQQSFSGPHSAHFLVHILRIFWFTFCTFSGSHSAHFLVHILHIFWFTFYTLKSEKPI